MTSKGTKRTKESFKMMSSHPPINLSMICLLLLLPCLSSAKILSRFRKDLNTQLTLHQASLHDVTPYVTSLLNTRMQQVNSQQRSKQFSSLLKTQSKSILSTHGDEVRDSSELIQIPELSTKTFPSDLSLDLTFPENLYGLAQNDIEARIHKETQACHEQYSREILYGPKLCWRGLKLMCNFLPVNLTSGMALLSANFRNKVWYNLLARCLAKSGPAFIKWGQWASTRSDMFPDALCQALSELHADAPAHSWKITQQTVEESLCIPKRSLTEVFQQFDKQPVASGSIAQIHKAIIHPTVDVEEEQGTLVAVKVRHPNVAKLIDMDFRIMAMLASIIDHLPGLGWLRIRQSLDQFSHTMAAQAHLHVEGYHLEVLNHNFRHWPTVSLPKPIFACSQVIIETFEEGKICSNVIDKYVALADNVNEEIMKDKKQRDDENDDKELIPLKAGDVMPVPLQKFIVCTGLALYLKMLILDNLMHADLHPGNIMVLAELFDHGDVISNILHPDTVTEHHVMKMAAAELSSGFYGHITLVDAGMVAQLEEDESANFIGLMASLGAGDGYSAARAVLNFSKEKGYLTREEETAFESDMVSFFQENCRGYGTNVDVGAVLRGVLGIIKDHHVRIDANYATLVVNALCIEGLGKRVCPSYNVLDAAEPLLSTYHKYASLYRTENKALKHIVTNYITPMLYMRKDSFDRKFFKQLSKERKRNSYVSQVCTSVAKSLITALSIGIGVQTIIKCSDSIDRDEMLGLLGFRKKSGADSS